MSRQRAKGGKRGAPHRRAPKERGTASFDRPAGARAARPPYGVMIATAAASSLTVRQQLVTSFIADPLLVRVLHVLVQELHHQVDHGRLVEHRTAVSRTFDGVTLSFHTGILQPLEQLHGRHG